MRIKLAASDFRHRPGADQHAVAQRRDAVGHAGQLFETMRDVDDSDTLGLQLGDHAEEPVDFLVAERGRRLVHDQDAGVGARGPARSRPAAARASTACSTSESGSIAAPIRSSRRRARARRAVQRTRRHAPPALEPDRDVLGDGQVAEEGGLLVDRRDAQVARRSRDPGPRPAGPGSRSCPSSGSVRAGDHLDQRRLARAVLADQGVNFAGAQVERDTLEGLDSGKRLADLESA